MKKLKVLPTWILLKMMKPLLPKKHEWKNKNFTLTDWANGSTPLNDSFSMLFWLTAVSLIFMGFILCCA